MQKGPSDFLKLGEWNAICDVCGRKFKSSQLKRRWDGFRVCKDDWEKRHEQDFLRGRPDNPSVAWARPEQADKFSTSAPADPNSL